MRKPQLNNKVLVYMFGLPGSGKTYISRQLSEYFGMAHISADRLRYELFDEPKYDKNENLVITHLMDYMSEEYLKNDVSVIYDVSVSKINDRRNLKLLAHANKAKNLLIWVQIDVDTAWTRTQSRDKRKIDDKYSSIIDQSIFENYMKSMQNPINENYLVLSGKHMFNSHKNAFIRRFNEMGALDIQPSKNVLPKPGLVNLVSQAQLHGGRVDYNRRNLTIR